MLNQSALRSIREAPLEKGAECGLAIRMNAQANWSLIRQVRKSQLEKELCSDVV
jgi:hypothetical protein